jgi:hypothetical protein
MPTDSDLCPTIVVSGRRRKQILVVAATLKLHAANATMLAEKEKEKGLESPLRKVCCPVCQCNNA